MGLFDADLERLAKLGEPRASGVLTEQEFAQLKAEVLEKPAPAVSLDTTLTAMGVQERRRQPRRQPQT
jgi:hypothetical protein